MRGCLTAEGTCFGGLYNVTAAAAALGANNFVTKAGTDGDQTQVAELDQHEGHRAAGERTVPAGRLQHLEYTFGLLRDTEPAARMDGRQCAEPDQPLVRHVDRVASRVSPASGRTTFPKIDVQIAGTMRSDPGGDLDGELGRAEFGHCRAEPALRRRRGSDGDGQPHRAWHVVR